jgi:hypothetical protein
MEREKVTIGVNSIRPQKNKDRKAPVRDIHF